MEMSFVESGHFSAAYMFWCHLKEHCKLTLTWKIITQETALPSPLWKQPREGNKDHLCKADLLEAGCLTLGKLRNKREALKSSEDLHYVWFLRYT